MCIQDCRTFFWGGTGHTAYDAGGVCFCVCEDDAWSDINILGRAACVPVLAHQVFGWLGLAIATVALCHALYNLARQVEFHAHQNLPVVSPVERCRRDMHVTAAAGNFFSIGFFVMVIRHEIRAAVIMLAITASPISICGAIFAGRMWIYTKDPRLLQESPKIVAISAWLERPYGQYVTHSAVSIGPAVGAGLAAVNKTETSIKVVAAGFCLLILIVGRMFWICGISLMKAIDDSLRRAQHANGQSKERRGMGRSSENSHGGGGVGPTLVGAKRKVMRMMIFTGNMSVVSLALILFVIFGKCGTVAPLPLFVGPMFLMSPIWIAANIQLHAGRTKLRCPRDGFSSSPVQSVSARALRHHQPAKVVPFRGIASFP